jgi:CheY-like chemotaxis protein
MRDLSDRRKAEAAARLAGVGTLAAGVAHEINNPLTFVAANLELAGDALDALAQRPAEAVAIAAEARRALADAQSGALRVRDIVRDLKVFSREEEGVGPVDVRRALQAALSIARNELRHRARVTVQIEATVAPVMANEHRLGQVFLNLLVNAAQAIAPGRTEGHEVAVAVRQAGDEVVVEVRDSGAGMGPQVRARIFEPFFTTKPIGQGTGLGLSICHGIIVALGGRIEVESQEGEGSTFRVVLPAAPPGTVTAVGPIAASLPASAPAPPGPDARTAGQPSVLVVDDEAMVGSAVRRLLSGYSVTVLDRARQALAVIEGGAQFDVVLCDLMMPDMTGMELHARVASSAPRLAERFLFVTGGAFTDEAREFLERHAGRRLEKPFDVQQLREAVAAVVREGGRP